MSSMTAVNSFGDHLTIGEHVILGHPEWRVRSASQPFSSTEITLLVAGAKPALLTHGRERELTALAEWFRSRGLTSLLSPTQFELAGMTSTGYSNLSTTPTQAIAGSNGHRWLATSRSERVARQLWLAASVQDDRTIGRYLGYPSCCQQAFFDLWPVAEALYGGDVPVLQAFERPVDAPRKVWPAHVNVFGRYFGTELVQHFPCSPTCEPTARIAMRHQAAIEWADPLAADRLAMLEGCVVIASDGEVALLPGAGQPAALTSATDPTKWVCAGESLRQRVTDESWLRSVPNDPDYRVHWYAEGLRNALPG